VALALGTKNPREIFEIGFGGETIHPSWSLGRDHPDFFIVLTVVIFGGFIVLN
jgi:hypothetical protein